MQYKLIAAVYWRQNISNVFLLQTGLEPTFSLEQLKNTLAVSECSCNRQIEIMQVLPKTNLYDFNAVY